MKQKEYVDFSDEIYISTTHSTDIFNYEYLLKEIPAAKGKNKSIKEWIKDRDNRKEFILYCSIVLTFISLLLLYNSLNLTRLQILLSNQPFLTIKRTGEWHSVEVKDSLLLDNLGRLTVDPYLEFHDEKKEFKSFAKIPILNYGNGNAVNIRLTMSLNQDSVYKIISKIFSDSFIDSCKFNEGGIMFPRSGGGSIPRYINYYCKETYDFISNNSDSSQTAYFSLPYDYYYLLILQQFVLDDFNDFTNLKVDLLLEYEDLAGNKKSKKYELGYIMHGGGASGKHGGGGGEIVTTIISEE